MIRDDIADFVVSLLGFPACYFTSGPFFHFLLVSILYPSLHLRLTLTMVSANSVLTGMGVGAFLYTKLRTGRTSQCSTPGYNTHILFPPGSQLSDTVLSSPGAPMGFWKCPTQECSHFRCFPATTQPGLKTHFGPQDHGSVHKFGVMLPLSEKAGEQIERLLCTRDRFRVFER
jgi:hypothetical protein